MPQRPQTQPAEATEAEAKMLHQLAGEVRSVTQGLQNLVHEIHQNAQTVAILRTEFSAVKSDVGVLSELFRGGTAGGVFGRLALLERAVEKMLLWTEQQTQRQTKEAEEARDAAEAARQAARELLQKDQASKWNTIGVFITAGLSFLASVIATLISVLRK